MNEVMKKEVQIHKQLFYTSVLLLQVANKNDNMAFLTFNLRTILLPSTI